MMRMTLMTVMCVMAMLAVAAQSRAEVLITNLTGDYSTFGTSLGASYSAGNRKAGGFRMGDNSFLLDSVELYLGDIENSDFPVISLFDNGVGDEPDNLLITLNNPAFNYGGSTDTYAFTPGTDFELAANTDYWIVVSNASVGEDAFEWLAPSDWNSLPVGPMATSTGYLHKIPSTGPWDSSIVPNAYAVNGIIPEPATGILLALGLASLAGRRSRQALHIISGRRKHTLSGGENP